MEESNFSKKKLLRKRFFKSVKLILVVLLIVGFWNVRLLFNLSRPALVRLSPKVFGQAEMVGDRIEYVNLGISVPIKIRPNLSPAVQSDWDTVRADLKEGAQLSFIADNFRDATNAYLVAHSSDFYPQTYSSAFAGLGQAKINDEFRLFIGEEQYIYKVSEILNVSPFAVEDEMKKNIQEGKQYVALVTCWPLLTTRDRLLVIGERIIASP